MKLLTINICPPDKCPDYLKNTLTNLGPENRAKKIIDLIRDKDPDVVFFIEQWYPVYSLVKSELEPAYQFKLPDGFNPAKKHKGQYTSYAGVVAAIKSGITVTAAVNGKDFVTQAGKWLSLEIGGHKYLGVHYPQNKHNITVFEKFHNGVMKFAAQEKPLAIMGDFNTPIEIGTITIRGYQDSLPENEATTAFDTKLDYIFLPKDYCDAKTELIHSARIGETVFSDHSITTVTL